MTLLILPKFPKACLFDLYTCSFLPVVLGGICNAQCTFQWYEKLSVSRWGNIITLHHIMFGKHKAPREMQLAPWSTNEIFWIMLTCNSMKYSHCIRNNTFCLNVQVCLFHQTRIKGKKKIQSPFSFEKVRVQNQTVAALLEVTINLRKM